MNGSQFLYISYFISVFMLIFAGIVTARFVIPLQVKESRVRNGLIRIRQLMLAKGLLSEIVIITAIAALTLRFFVNDEEVTRYLISFLILIFSIGIFGKSLFDSRIYHTQFSEKSKQHHNLVADMEENGGGK